MAVIFKLIVAWALAVKLLSGKYQWEINIGSGDCLMPSGNKPLPEPYADQDLCCHMASLGHNELNNISCHYIDSAGKFNMFLSFKTEEW